MNRMLVLALAISTVTACGGGTQTPQERLVGKWFTQDSTGTKGVELDFHDDGTYELAFLTLLSSTSANAQIEKGIYATSDTDIVFTPGQWTCPSPDPVWTSSYSFSGSSLALTMSTGLVAFSPNTNPPAMNASIAFGCFDNAGNFTPAALAPVSN